MPAPRRSADDTAGVLSVVRLRALRELQRHGTIVAAAEALRYTPSALSQQLAALERETGAALLERGARSVRLTPAGRALAEHAQAILERIEAAERDLRAHAAGEHGSLRLGATPAVAADVVPAAIGAFVRAHPGIDLGLVEGAPAVLLAGVAAAELDLAVVHDATLAPVEVPRGVVLETAAELPVGLLVPARHPLARRGAVRLGLLGDAVWVSGPPGSPDDLLLLAAAAGAGFAPHVRLRSEAPDVVRALVAAGAGVALAPEPTEDAPAPGTARRALDDLAARRRIVLATRSGDPNPAVPAMAERLREASAPPRRS